MPPVALLDPTQSAPGGARTLVCVLDWGLGHASRSLALLDHPALSGDDIYLASSGQALQFLRRERPDLPIHELPAYDVRYPTRHMPLNVALQWPRWWLTARRERKEVARLVRAQSIDRIISDNRFGCWSRAIPSIFLTHQLHPITHSRPVSWLYRRYLRRFTAFWVPDTEDRALSGQLSKPDGYENVQYIGPLSRLDPVAVDTQDLTTLTILSGPEPMRTRLERGLLVALASVPGRHALVRGLPSADHLAAPDNFEVHNFADRAMLSALIPRAQTLICRPGYSTLMDLAATHCTAKLILIPTPGQTEQSYLALSRVRSNGKGAVCLAQDRVGELGDML